MRCSSRSSLPRVLLVLALFGALPWVGCGDEDLPATEELSLRELLGLSTERTRALAAAERAAFAERLVAEWQQQAVSSDEQPRVPRSELDSRRERALQWAVALDRRRAAEGLEVRLVSRAEANAAAAIELVADPSPPELLGVASGQGLRIAPLSEGEPAFAGELLYSESFESVDRDGRRESAELRRLEPVFRRFLFARGLATGIVGIARAERAPLALYWVEAERVLWINPNLLWILAEEAGGEGAGDPIVADTRWTPDFITQCVAEQQLRCTQCFGAGGDPSQAVCSPLFPVAGADREATARAECAAFDRDEPSYALLCYNAFIDANLGCFFAAIDAEGCGAQGAPYTNLQSIAGLEPMTSDSACQSALVNCQEDRVTEPTPPPPPNWDDGDDDDDDDWAEDCASSMCDLSGICGEVDCGDSGCEGDTGGGDCGGDSGSGGGLCDGADLCSGDASANAPRQLGWDLILAPPFVFLIGLWWRGRPGSLG